MEVPPTFLTNNRQSDATFQMKNKDFLDGTRMVVDDDSKKMAAKATVSLVKESLDDLPGTLDSSEENISDSEDTTVP